MHAPPYLLPRPDFKITPEVASAFDNLFHSAPPGAFIDYSLPYPKWQFLSFLCESKDLVLHGSQNLEITQVEPRQLFIQEPAQQAQGVEIVFPHWVSSQPVQPIAKLLVEPDDFPFLDQIHGHNDEKLARLASANPNGFPWLEALES